MEKLRSEGGIKLINTKLKSETPKIHWLINLITDEQLKLHLNIFNSLIGIQKGNLKGEDIIFTEEVYIKKYLQLNNNFYMEAFRGISRLNTWKHISNINNEHLYFNPIFTTTTDDEIHERSSKCLDQKITDLSTPVSPSKFVWIV